MGKFKKIPANSWNIRERQMSAIQARKPVGNLFESVCGRQGNNGQEENVRNRNFNKIRLVNVAN